MTETSLLSWSQQPSESGEGSSGAFEMLLRPQHYVLTLVFGDQLLVNNNQHGPLAPPSTA